ncbi:ricin-type beta-trefoil lectin domain protein [Streptomyces sp. NPDC058678]|uniref:ricin-type beta-trefoil lectin domain protein n=1 Tax=Streptomyces sp. NPDC058678 TaxID=3346595 RepID=UPI003663CA2C
MADVLRMGGPGMFRTAQDALNQTPDKLHTAANRERWTDTPLAKAFEADRATASKEGEALDAYTEVWKKPLDGLSTPAGFTVTGFHWPPGTTGTGPGFFEQTGLSKWIWDRFWKSEEDFYEDPTPLADEATLKAVKDLGTPLYGNDPDPSLPGQEWQRARAEHQAWDGLVNWSLEPTGADNARVFLGSGGFPRTAPEPGSVEHRIAVEDLKTRFASCAWRGPVDPNKVLGKEVADASAEWQQEISSQATQRNQILTANVGATKALATGSKALGEMLGHSWIADRLARWQDYWSAGGPGWIGDSPMAIHAHGAADKCLEVGASGKTNGLPVQIYTCNGSAGQKWSIRGGALVNVNSGKCLDIKSSGTANGTTLQIWTCNDSAAQKWEYTTHATTRLYNPGTGNCLDLATYVNGRDTRMWDCKGTDPQKFDITPAGHNGTDDIDYPTKAQFDKAKKGVTDAQAASKKQLDLLKAQATAAKTAATTTDTATQAAYAVADKAGAPRGRGLLVGQQKAQVTKASSAALEALSKAGDTAYAATRASVGDSATIAARALTQAAASKAAFRTAAANEARAQAKAAADAAAVQAQTAKTARDTAKLKLAETLKAEADAKSAAATAHAERLAAEAEEATAKAEKATAAQKQAEAAQHKENAQGYAKTATEAKGRAETAESTARTKRQDAEAARDRAKGKRDDAWDAESKSNAARAKANAKDAYAEAHASDADAKESRAAADAKKQADASKAEAVKAVAGAADAAGHAYTTAQAAQDAGNSAQQVAAPANDAIQLGSPYVTTDSAAGLVVLTGQSSKTIAEQQQAVAEAHAANAQKNATQAQSLANAATGDAKAAYTLAAEAAGFAADARKSAKEALGYAAEAAKYAADAQKSLARTIEYNRQATEDAAAADKAAGRAEGYAADARASADQAALDAEAARTAASEAEQAAKDARAAADRADVEATAAEEAAKDAKKYADSAQAAADQAGREDANKQVQTGAGTGVGGVFSVIDDLKQKGDPQRLPDDCSRLPCDLVYKVTFDAVVSYYLCANPDVPATESGCPAEDTFFLTTKTFPGLSKTVKLSSWDATKQLWTGLFEALISDFTGCYHKITSADDGGSYGDCAWAASNFIPGKAYGLIADAIRALNAAMRRGDGVADALKALRKLDVDPDTLADIERTVDAFEETRTACRINSFPGGTEVVLADGSRKPIREVRLGDLLLATDPDAGTTRGEPVTRTFSHPAADLLEITLADGGRLTSTPGHQLFVVDRGWTLASDLRTGDRLRVPDGALRTVAALRDRNESKPRTVYDLTVSGLHTFYAVAGSTPVLVHNCNDLAGDESVFRDQAHTLRDHVRPDAEKAKELAEAKTIARGQETPNSVWENQAKAQEVVDAALNDSAKKISNWLRKNETNELSWSGTHGPKDSPLGTVYWRNGDKKASTNQFFIKIVRSPVKHKAGYYVQTCYPK